MQKNKIKHIEGLFKQVNFRISLMGGLKRNIVSGTCLVRGQIKHWHYYLMPMFFPPALSCPFLSFLKNIIKSTGAEGTPHRR